MAYDGKGWDGMGWDGTGWGTNIGWDRMGWDGIRRDGTGWGGIGWGGIADHLQWRPHSAGVVFTWMRFCRPNDPAGPLPGPNMWEANSVARRMMRQMWAPVEHFGCGAGGCMRIALCTRAPTLGRVATHTILTMHFSSRTLTNTIKYTATKATHRRRRVALSWGSRDIHTRLLTPPRSDRYARCGLHRIASQENKATLGQCSMTHLLPTHIARPPPTISLTRNSVPSQPLRLKPYAQITEEIGPRCPASRMKITCRKPQSNNAENHTV